MKLLKKHLKPLGFKGTSMYKSASWQMNWYRVFPRQKAVIGISCWTPDGVYRFDLSPKNMKAFQAGKLSLTPPGCCHPWNRPNLTRFKWVHEGPLKNQKHLREVLDSTGLPFRAGHANP